MYIHVMDIIYIYMVFTMFLVLCEPDWWLHHFLFLFMFDPRSCDPLQPDLMGLRLLLASTRNLGPKPKMRHFLLENKVFHLFIFGFVMGGISYLPSCNPSWQWKILFTTSNRQIIHKEEILDYISRYGVFQIKHQFKETIPSLFSKHLFEYGYRI